MTETRYEHPIEPRLEAAGGHSGAFLKGLVGGALLGTAAGVLFAPQIYGALRNVRRQLSIVAADAGDSAAERYRDASIRVGDAVGDLQQRGRGAYGKALGVVVRGAEDVRERATEAQAKLDHNDTKAPRRS